MRTLLIGALAATLAGCSCLLPPQASMDACTDGFACFDRAAAERIRPEPALFDGATKKVKARIAKTVKPSSADTRDRVTLPDAKEAKPATITAKVEPPPVQPAETSDPLINKAKATIAAELEDPASAEFVEMNRAVRKTMLGESDDTICGRVKGKKTSGEDTGERLFLYLVEEDQAYVVDGAAGSAAASAYRNICK
jgi:hypothetical protein